MTRKDVRERTQLENSTEVILCHPRYDCDNDHCPIHKRTEHHMRGWPQHWRGDRHMMERICPCGIGHPDSDDPAEDRVHGCCGDCIELWKAIPGFENSYEVSSQGRVRSLVKKRGFVSGKERILVPRFNEKGYTRISLGTGNDRYIHRLVLEAFEGPCPEGMECCHKNGFKDDNRLLNLRWDTSAANEADSVRLGKKPIGENHKNSKLSAANVSEIREGLRQGKTMKFLGEKFGVGAQAICDIKHRKTWKHLPEGS